MSAQVDVRAAFAELDRTLPGPPEDPTLPGPQEERTLPGPPEEPTLPGPQEDRTLALTVSFGTVDEPPPMRPRAYTLPLLQQPNTEPSLLRSASTKPLAPNTGQAMPVQAMPVHGALPDAAAEDTFQDVPGGAARRRRMQRIVMGVLGFCGLVCVGALVVRLRLDAKPEETRRAESKSAASVIAPTSAASESQGVASASAPLAGEAAPTAPVVTAAVSPQRRPEAHGSAPHPRPPVVSGPAPTKPPPRTTIMRDAPF